MLVLLAELASAELKESVMDIHRHVVNATSALQSILKKTFGSMPKTTSL
jgi:hypothetical protein